MDKMHEIYCMVLENNQVNIQILKNQRHLLQQCQGEPFEMKPTESLIEETNNILRMITSGEE